MQLERKINKVIWLKENAAKWKMEHAVKEKDRCN
jgi:hypothetical protein